MAMMKTKLPHFQCQNCKTDLKPSIALELFPVLDSNGSGLAGLLCPRCNYCEDFMVGDSDASGLLLEQIRIVGMPGPDYESLYSEHIQPLHPLGWFLNAKESYDLWNKRNWNIYVYNWVLAGLPPLFVEAAYVSRLCYGLIDETHTKTIGKLLRSMTYKYSLWCSTRFDVVLSEVAPDLDPTISLGAEFDPDLGPEYRAKLSTVAKQASEKAYRAYHGGNLDEDWLKANLPMLHLELVKLARLLPQDVRSTPRPMPPNPS